MFVIANQLINLYCESSYCTCSLNMPSNICLHPFVLVHILVKLLLKLHLPAFLFVFFSTFRTCLLCSWVARYSGQLLSHKLRSLSGDFRTGAQMDQLAGYGNGSDSSDSDFQEQQEPCTTSKAHKRPRLMAQGIATAAPRLAALRCSMCSSERHCDHQRNLSRP